MPKVPDVPDVWSKIRDACLLVEYDGAISAANQAACELLCYDERDLVGSPIYGVMATANLQQERGVTTRLVAGHCQIRTVEWRLGDGRTATVDVIWVPASVGSHTVALGILRPTARTELAVDSSQSRERQLEDLYLTSALSVAHLPLAEVLKRLAEQLAVLTSARSSGIYIHDPDRDVLVLEAAYGVSQDSVGTALARGEGLSWQCFGSGEVINTANYGVESNAIDLDSRFGFGTDHYQTVPVLIVPLKYADRSIGVLALGEPTGGEAFGASDEYIGRLLANQVSVAIEQSRLYGQVKASAEELARANKNLLQLDSLKDDLMMMIGHELQQPLATARLGIDLVLHDMTSLDDRYRGLLAQSIRSLDALGGVLGDMLYLTGLRALGDETREPVDLRPVVQSVLDEAAPHASEKGLEMTLESPSCPVWVRVPTEALRRMTLHLLSNAIKFTSSGSVHVQIRASEGKARLAVDDTGIGVSPDEERRIFEAFYQADGSSRRAFDGMGLGLALVRRVAELYGGRVAVSSHPGAGSRFEVAFDLAGES